jgi:hypothetical protein
MKNLVALSVLGCALAASSICSQACDYEHQATNATPIVSAATDQSTVQQPATTAEPATPTVTGAENVPPLSPSVTWQTAAAAVASAKAVFNLREP